MENESRKEMEKEGGMCGEGKGVNKVRNVRELSYIYTLTKSVSEGGNEK